METVAVVLSVGKDHVEDFEAGFRKHELRVWKDLQKRGLLEHAYLNRLDISTSPVKNATQYMVVAVFTSGEGHHAHDDHPGFKAWNDIADTYQVSGALAFGGETVIKLESRERVG
jgi:quinol monooxygenase YgiN